MRIFLFLLFFVLFSRSFFLVVLIKMLSVCMCRHCNSVVVVVWKNNFTRIITKTKTDSLFNVGLFFPLYINDNDDDIWWWKLFWQTPNNTHWLKSILHWFLCLVFVPWILSLQRMIFFRVEFFWILNFFFGSDLNVNERNKDQKQNNVCFISVT